MLIASLNKTFPSFLPFYWFGSVLMDKVGVDYPSGGGGVYKGEVGPVESIQE